MDNTTFWTQLTDFFERNTRIKRPDLMIGDCNMVEEAMDRLPMRSDTAHSVDALDDLKCLLNLEDGWRNTYPDSLKYTFKRTTQQGHIHHSRLD